MQRTLVSMAAVFAITLGSAAASPAAAVKRTAVANPVRGNGLEAYATKGDPVTHALHANLYGQRLRLEGVHYADPDGPGSHGRERVLRVKSLVSLPRFKSSDEGIALLQVLTRGYALVTLSGGLIVASDEAGRQYVLSPRTGEKLTKGYERIRVRNGVVYGQRPGALAIIGRVEDVRSLLADALGALAALRGGR
jgi:hypothetical protein